MWRLTEIKFSNIVSFHEASLTFDQGVATLIFGKNEDNASQPCNGSGKSSLIEAISLALTGEPLRKVKSVEEIINDDAEEAYDYIRLDNDYDGSIFTIERTISRNAPQVIECHKYDVSGVEIETDKTIQPTVLDYNRFILSELGLTKDDIYNNFILCDNKYESFFDCSDRNKKEVINRFSNGVIVDESIARLQEDMIPVSEQLDKANNEVISIKGSISAIERELEHVDEKAASARLSRQNRIQNLNEKIQLCNSEIEAAEANIRRGNDRLRTLKRLQSQVAGMENADMTLIEAYDTIKSLCDEYSLGGISDFAQLSDIYKKQLEEQHEKIFVITEQIADTEKVILECKRQYDTRFKDYQVNVNNNTTLRAKDSKAKSKLTAEVQKIDEYLDNLEALMKDNKKRSAELEAQIARNEALLNGAVTCPKCAHRFFVDNNASVEEIKDRLAGIKGDVAKQQTDLDALNKQFDEADSKAVEKSNEIQAIQDRIKERDKKIEEERDSLQFYLKSVNDEESSLLQLRRSLVLAQNEVDKLSGKIDVLKTRLFGEISGIFESRISSGNQYVVNETSLVSFSKGQLKQYQESKDELINAPETDFASSLKSSLETYLTNLAEAEKTAAEIQAEYDTLKGQEVNFTMFKSHIARKKIDALSLIINDFLEKIGSDIRLKLEGFTVTKTGKFRDKISVQVMRDGIDCGSYHKFSGGEKARLNLACILALHTLTNSNCEDGKGLDFIIIDELLDKSDEVGMATYCEALNKLKQTSLLITQGGVSEGYPHKLLVVKKQGVSSISK